MSVGFVKTEHLLLLPVARGRVSVVRAACLFFIRVGADSLAPGDIGVAQGSLDEIRIPFLSILCLG